MRGQFDTWVIWRCVVWRYVICRCVIWRYLIWRLGDL